MLYLKVRHFVIVLFSLVTKLCDNSLVLCVCVCVCVDSKGRVRF
jgi:hypothetical protein